LRVRSVFRGVVFLLPDSPLRGTLRARNSASYF
jgi:hypothetical protein